MTLPLEYILIKALQTLVMCMAVVVAWRAVRLAKKAQEQADGIRRIADLQSAMIKILMDGNTAREGNRCWPAFSDGWRDVRCPHRTTS